MDMISDQNKKLKYPKSIWSIVLNEFCERFTYYGLKTVFIFYLTTILQFNGDNSTIIYHSFVFLAYFMPLPGALLADSYWGKYKTIFSLSMVYALRSVVLTGSSMADYVKFSLDVQKIFSLFGLFLIAVGTGGIKPCVFTFGGDQFQLPRQEKHLLHYATKFSMAIGVGALISSFLTPELRQNVHCLGRDTCFPLAFGVPALLMFTAIAIFVSGNSMYVKKKPQQNAIPRTFSCIFYALRTKMTSPAPSKDHWLDNAKGRYTEAEISDTKSVLNVICVLTASGVLVVNRTTGLQVDVTSHADERPTGLLKLDHQARSNARDRAVSRNGISHPLRRRFVSISGQGRRPKTVTNLTFSGILAILAFVLTAILQLKMTGNTTEVPPGQGA